MVKSPGIFSSTRLLGSHAKELKINTKNHLTWCEPFGRDLFVRLTTKPNRTTCEAAQRVYW
jgi:hypothetical protein